MEKIGDRIRKARKEKKITQGKLAELCSSDSGKVTTAAVSNWENGINDPASAKYNIIAKALGVSAEWLISGNQSALSLSQSSFEHAPLPLIPVIGSVQAGVFQPALQEDGDWERIPFPTPGGYKPEDFYILKVRGDSMDQVYPEGYNLVCVKLMAYHGALTHGKRVIVHRRDQYSDQFEATVKELFHDTENKRWLLMPRSHNPQYRPISIPNGNGDELDFAGSDDLNISGVVYTGFMPEPGF
ncbi:MAG: helix-turn-helix domain-containing protein [Terasakiella sp.]|uniref:helix-turn-helix domain-containing protein n=1 Tax=unclassified Terasakiella TaxID=2614952 RepID=UPI003AFF899B